MTLKPLARLDEPPDPLRRRCFADLQDCQNSANADFLTILNLARPIESATSRRLRACIDPLKMLKIEKDSDGRRTLIRLIGRIQSCDLNELRKQMQSSDLVTTLDFDQVTLVDVDVVRFLCHCEKRGVQVAKCSPYILEWMLREQHAGLEPEGKSDACQ